MVKTWDDSLFTSDLPVSKNGFIIYLVDIREFEILEGGYFAAAPWMVMAVAASVGGLWWDRLCKRFGPRWGCRISGIVGLFLAAATGIMNTGGNVVGGVSVPFLFLLQQKLSAG